MSDYYKTEPWIMRSDLYRSQHPNCEVCGIPPDTAKPKLLAGGGKAHE